VANVNLTTSLILQKTPKFYSSSHTKVLELVLDGLAGLEFQATTAASPWSCSRSGKQATTLASLIGS
jgi:hypothetical protein